MNHTVKGFTIVSKAEVDGVFFFEFSCFFCDPVNVANLIAESSLDIVSKI